MSRPDARINVILDAVVARLLTIDGDPDTYLTHPKKVLRWCENPLVEPTPLLVVRCSAWGPNEPQTGLQHEARADIEVEVWVKFEGRIDDPNRELHRACSDVMCAIEADWQLSDLNGDVPAVPDLQIHVFDGYEPASSPGAAGYARAVVKLRAYWPWDSTAA